MWFAAERWLACGVLASTLGCTVREPPRKELLPEAPRVWFIPGDGMTDVGSTVPAVTLHTFRPLGAAALADMAAHVQLATWPALSPIAATLDARDASATPSEPQPPEIRVIPAAPLADGWYLLSVDKLPAGYTWASDRRWS